MSTNANSIRISFDISFFFGSGFGGVGELILI
jgi:hypothetical protein